MLKRSNKRIEAAEAAGLQEIHNAAIAAAVNEIRELNNGEELVAVVVQMQNDLNRLIEEGVDRGTAARKATARRFIMPTAAEDAEITAAAKDDDDNPPLTNEQLAQFKPARRGRGRPVQDVTKVQITIRLDADVLDSFKSTGDGWQTRINDALREWSKDHRMVIG
jgi:uncharacterized protein (DUF4415 family)